MGQEGVGHVLVEDGLGGDEVEGYAVGAVGVGEGGALAGVFVVSSCFVVAGFVATRGMEGRRRRDW